MPEEEVLSDRLLFFNNSIISSLRSANSERNWGVNTSLGALHRSLSPSVEIWMPKSRNFDKNSKVFIVQIPPFDLL